MTAPAALRRQRASDGVASVSFAYKPQEQPSPAPAQPGRKVSAGFHRTPRLSPRPSSLGVHLVPPPSQTRIPPAPRGNGDFFSNIFGENSRLLPTLPSLTFFTLLGASYSLQPGSAGWEQKPTPATWEGPHHPPTFLPGHAAEGARGWGGGTGSPPHPPSRWRSTAPT